MIAFMWAMATAMVATASLAAAPLSSSSPGRCSTSTGNFSDTFVIGRDSGSGTVIQNGGTFTFNPANDTICLFARGATDTQAEYDMNGGLCNRFTYTFRSLHMLVP